MEPGLHAPGTIGWAHVLAAHRFGLRDFCVNNTANETGPGVSLFKRGKKTYITEKDLLFGNLGAVVSATPQKV